MNKSVNSTKLLRNLGSELDLDWVLSTQANTSAIERRANNIGTRRSIKKQYQAAWLLKAITLIDLTTLSGDDTERRVERLCAKGKKPISKELTTELGINELDNGLINEFYYKTVMDNKITDLSSYDIIDVSVIAAYQGSVSANV